MSRTTINAAARRAFTQPLMQWYRIAGRDLPWRKTSDPYAVWVSEIMLQQTQVATVLPYYQRFLNAFPTVGTLAAADLEKVLKLWEGLGYYARARHLHQAAQDVVSQFSGEIPQTFEALHALPGIGRSTAGAILGIACGKRYPILDGNVRRVLCRFFAVENDPRGKETEDWLWSCSETLLPKRAAGLYMQAIMDLGATICTPRQPSCFRCPVEKSCEARKKGLEGLLPVKAARKSIPHFNHFAGVLIYDDEVLICRRPLTGLLAGLWEFPGERIKPGSLSPAAACIAYFQSINVDTPTAHPFMVIQHVFTHFKMTLHVFSFYLKKSLHVVPPLKWVRPERLSDHPFSAAHQKIVRELNHTNSQLQLFRV